MTTNKEIGTIAKKSMKQRKIDMHKKMGEMHLFQATKELTEKGESERHRHAAFAHSGAAQMLRDNAKSSRHPHNPQQAEAVTEELSARAFCISPAEMRSNDLLLEALLSMDD